MLDSRQIKKKSLREKKLRWSHFHHGKYLLSLSFSLHSIFSAQNLTTSSPLCHKLDSNLWNLANNLKHVTISFAPYLWDSETPLFCCWLVYLEKEHALLHVNYFETVFVCILKDYFQIHCNILDNIHIFIFIYLLSFKIMLYKSR